MLQDKVAIVTGAGSGIGRASALLFARHGAKVALVDLNAERAEQVRDLIAQENGQAIVVKADVADSGEMQAAVAAAIDEWDKLDIVFANAGINGLLTPIEDMSLDEWDKTLSTNLTGAFLTVKHAVPHMKQSGGSIIITSSINGNRIFNNLGLSAYSSAKAGQVAFMKMAALELARYKIRVNAICPGAIRTNLFESTRVAPELKKIEIKVNYPDGNKPLNHAPGQPEQVAELAFFLASDMSSHVTGTEIYIDGAESLL